MPQTRTLECVDALSIGSPVVQGDGHLREERRSICRRKISDVANDTTHGRYPRA
jgi:hypothetical protein